MSENEQGILPDKFCEREEWGQKSKGILIKEKAAKGFLIIILCSFLVWNNLFLRYVFCIFKSNL